MELLINVARTGTTVVMVTHSLTYAALAARTIKLLDGRIVSELAGCLTRGPDTATTCRRIAQSQAQQTGVVHQHRGARDRLCRGLAHRTPCATVVLDDSLPGERQVYRISLTPERAGSRRSLGHRRSLRGRIPQAGLSRDRHVGALVTPGRVCAEAM